MFIRLKMKSTDIIKNAERIDSIYKSVYRKPLNAEELANGIEPTFPSIKIKYTEEVDGNNGIELPFDSEQERDKRYEEFSNALDARLFE